MRAGLPVYEGLRIVRNQKIKKRFRNILDEVMRDINNGKSLADSFERQGNAFGNFFISLVRIGETSGTLAENLLYLSNELKKRRELRKKVRSAMVYPIILLIATVAIVALLVFFIFPKVMPMFENLGAELPTSTKIVIATTNFVSAYWMWLLGGAVGAFILWRLLLLVRPIRYALHYLFFFIPVIRMLTIDVNLANFSRVVAVLMRSGERIVNAVHVAARMLDNQVYRKKLEEATVSLEKGETIAGSFVHYPRLFPSMFVSMVEVGENTGNLQENLEYLAEFYEEELDSALRSLTTMLEPILLLVMGVIVGFIAISVITPIYSLTQSIGGA
ncbi:type II secretion system F family protein [Candidatus Parcubacteria bacterium]|nr:MAG: type II secretion system F family protein [Candidatus Parcubacteria bacterium]